MAKSHPMQDVWAFFSVTISYVKAWRWPRSVHRPLPTVVLPSFPCLFARAADRTLDFCTAAVRKGHAHRGFPVPFGRDLKTQRESDRPKYYAGILYESVSSNQRETQGHVRRKWDPSTPIRAEERFLREFVLEAFDAAQHNGQPRKSRLLFVGWGRNDPSSTIH